MDESKLEVRFTLAPRRVSRGSQQGATQQRDQPTSPGRTPRVSRLLALAIRFQDMARSNNANRSVQWEMLEKFAQGNGYYEPEYQAHKEREKQQVSRLGRALKTYFQIDGEPIVRDGQSWKTVFVIRPEGWKEPQDETWDLE